MREIKFRGKVKQSGNNYSCGDWVYGYYYSDMYCRSFIIDNDDDSDLQFCHVEIDFKTLGQYTGIKDDNGKDLYEGDIIKVADSWENYGMMAGEKREIYYHEATFKLKPKNGRGNGHYLKEGIEIEIIGNIHENKDIL